MRTDNDPMLLQKQSECFQGKELDIIQWPSQVTWLDFNPTEHALQLLQSGQKWRKNHKREATVGGCSEDLAEHLKGGNAAFNNGLGF